MILRSVASRSWATKSRWQRFFEDFGLVNQLQPDGDLAVGCGAEEGERLVDALDLEDRLLDVDGQGSADAKRRRAPDLVSGEKLRLLRVRQVHALHAEVSCQALGRYLAIAMHEHDEGVTVARLQHDRRYRGVGG